MILIFSFLLRCIIIIPYNLKCSNDKQTVYKKNSRRLEITFVGVWILLQETVDINKTVPVNDNHILVYEVQTITYFIQTRFKRSMAIVSFGRINILPHLYIAIYNNWQVITL